MSVHSNTGRGWVLALMILLNVTGTCVQAASDNPLDSNSGSNPYAVILERNVFRLNPPPPPPKPADLSSTQKRPEVAISGLMETGNQWKALLVVKSLNPDPHGQELISYLTLAEGDRQTVEDGPKPAEVELKRIDPQMGKIEIINMGEATNLSLEDNGIESMGAGPDARRTSTGVFRRGGRENQDATDQPPIPIMLRQGQPARRLLSSAQTAPRTAPVAAANIAGNASTANVSGGEGGNAPVDPGGANGVIVGGGGPDR
jgi:hypothetical protein